MSTYISLHTQSNQTEIIQNILANWLQTIHNAKSINITSKTSIQELFATNTLSSNNPPNWLAFKPNKAGWQTIEYNSFYPMEEVANQISKTLSCLVIIIIIQSVSEAYFISVHSKGQVVRVLEWVGDMGEWIRQDGQPFSFENSPIGCNIGSDQEPFYIIDRDWVTEYCSQLGLELRTDNTTLEEKYIVIQPIYHRVLETFFKFFRNHFL